MLFITYEISIITFRGSAMVILNTHLRIRRLGDHFAGLMVSLHPLPPHKSTIGVKNLEETTQLETIRKPVFYHHIRTHNEGFPGN